MDKKIIDIESSKDIDYWTKKLEITEQDLSVAVLMVGNEVESIIEYIKSNKD